MSPDRPAIAMPRLMRAVRLIAGNLLVLAALLVVAEGVASTAMFVRGFELSGDVAEAGHTRHDPDLGWVNLPNLRLPDFYRRGATLSTNNRGFRGVSDVESQAPPGKARVICSGDSFTLGYGVDDRETWCHGLSEFEVSWDPVNMGQGGYGLDQAYLWYKRDGANLEHRVHILAFITDDFRRMSTGELGGYGKPWLALDGARLVVRNTPVPTTSARWRWLARHAPLLRGLRSVDVLAKVAARAFGGATGQPPEWLPSGRRGVVSAMLDDLSQLHRERDRRFVVVHLPTRYELAAGGAREWTAFFMDESRRLDFEFVDLFPFFEALSAQDVRAMFIEPGDVPFPGAEGHYTAAGNARVARLLADVLASRPDGRPVVQ
jgi:hypothetical protein